MSTVLSDLIRATEALKRALINVGLKPDFDIGFSDAEALLDLHNALAKEVGGVPMSVLSSPDMIPGEFRLNGIKFHHRVTP